MISAFIDFVKPFSMLLPMCLQDSKSDLIQWNGAPMSMEKKKKNLAGEESKSRDQEHSQPELSATLA